MERRRNVTLGPTATALLVGLSAGCGDADAPVPTFEVALWPMPLEYPYILGAVTGVTVAPDGHVLVVTRQDHFNHAGPGSEIGATTMGAVRSGQCCVPTQAVLEFDPDGNLVREWGGMQFDSGGTLVREANPRGGEYTWFARPHGIAVDPQGNVWIGGSGIPDSADTHILKFTRDGQFLLQIGQAGAAPNSQSTSSFGGVARIAFDAGANEAYVADGFFNRRVVVLDINTGEVKRHWGAYGNTPDDSDLGPYDPAAPPAQHFRTVTCAKPSNDGLVYVCDRGNNRIQVFRTDGTFVTEKIIAPATRGAVTERLSKDRGSVWDVAFSPDAEQEFLYVADGINERVYILDRESLEVRTSFGVGGRYPSQFQAVGSIAVDSQGNIYTGEDEDGKRVQKFVNTGFGPVVAEHQGAVWPGRQE